MPGKAVGRVAVELPWLCPNTESLIALADAPATVVGLSAADPALSVFLLRFAQPASEPDTFNLAPGACLAAALPDTAAAFLALTTSGVLPAASCMLSRVRAVANLAAGLASRLAELTRLVPSGAAATVARLVPLGWYAVAAVDQFDAADPLADPVYVENPADAQCRAWGLDHAAITRRLAARWRLPNWVASTIGSLTHPLRVAGTLVSHRNLFAIVQLAVLEAEARLLRLGLAPGASRDELLQGLELDDRTVADLESPPAEPQAPVNSGLVSDPHKVPLVRNLLRIAAESRRRNGHALVARLEGQIDQLHRVATELGEQAGDRLREAKLGALAELAAGAGHEINNPLAVISGNAQRLLRTEPDPDRGESLRVIVRQSQRIAGILRDLMQFARPPRPEPRPFLLKDLLDGVREDLTSLAQERGVRLEFEGETGEVYLQGDPRQVRHSLASVVRNGVEAAGSVAAHAAGQGADHGATPPDSFAPGRVRVRCAIGDGDEIAIVVEDSGAGLSPEDVEHAFDPFYSGRSAGRGRGLGLPTAWQLIRQNGGDLRHEEVPDNWTRFVLLVPRAIAHELLSLRSA